jgi:dTDP-4-dehydrorhamnose 3,5-epimerase
MEFKATPLPGLVIVQPKVFRDPRGFFLEVYHEEKFRRAGIDAAFVQDNHSFSVHGVLRGLHGQLRRPQGKLVRAIEGEIYDVAVDLRRRSPTFRRWVGLRLSGETLEQLYIPPGFAHGFCVLSERAQVEYKCTALYDPADEFGIVWNDPELAIDWPLSQPVVSQKDAGFPPLKEVLGKLPDYPYP